MTRIDVWSDVVCPWCYIGKRHLEQALAGLPDADDVEVVWHSYQLDPSAPVGGGGSVVASLAEKYGVGTAQVLVMQQRVTDAAAAAGLEYHLEHTRDGNSLDAHRVLHLAASRGLQAEVKERLFRAHFTEGASVFDHEELTRLAVEAGLDAEEVRGVLAGDAYADGVAADLAQARAYGISSVPFFVVDARLGVAGAQPPAVLRQAIEQARAQG
ncbi:MAG: DsbA family oxidoreductase [Kineosporiaceae bacterium]